MRNLEESKSDISQKKRLINVNDGDTVNIILSETVIAFTNLPGVTDIAVLITFNGDTTWEATQVISEEVQLVIH